MVSVFERDRNLLEYLDSAGIRPGVQLEVVASSEGLDLRTGRQQIHLEPSVGSKIWVSGSDGDSRPEKPQ